MLYFGPYAQPRAQPRAQPHTQPCAYPRAQPSTQHHAQPKNIGTMLPDDMSVNFFRHRLRDITQGKK